MPLKAGSSQKVISENIHELTHHGSRPRSHEQIVAIALHTADKSKKDHYAPPQHPNPHIQHHTNADHIATSVDGDGHTGDHQHDHIGLLNAHPHAHASHPHIHRDETGIKPKHQSFNRGSNSMVSGTAHGQHIHVVHDRRDKGPEHHPPSGLMGHSVNGGY